MKLLIFVAALFLASCSSKNDATVFLTAAQRAEFAETAQDLGAAEKSGLAANSLQNVSSAGGANKTKALSIPVEMIARLKQCEIEFTVPPQSGGLLEGAGSLSGALKLAGAQCPVFLNLIYSGSYEFSQNLVRMDTNLDYNFNVIDKEFEQYLDITSLKVTGATHFQAMSGSLEGSFSVSGTVQSKKRGDLRLYSRGNLNGTNSAVSGEAVFGIEYPDYIAELKDVVSNENGKVVHVYTLNGEKITAAEYKEFLEELGSLGASSKQIFKDESKLEEGPKKGEPVINEPQPVTIP